MSKFISSEKKIRLHHRHQFRHQKTKIIKSQIKKGLSIYLKKMENRNELKKNTIINSINLFFLFIRFLYFLLDKYIHLFYYFFIKYEFYFLKK